MKKRDAERLLRAALVPSFPAYALRGDRLLRWDGDPILRGFVVDRSDNDPSRFNLWAVVQPLFIPASTVNLGTAAFIGGYDVRGAGAEELHAIMAHDASRLGQPFLAEMGTLRGFATGATPKRFPMTDRPYLQEGRAYAFAYLGDGESCTRELVDLLGRVRDDRVGRQIRARSERILSATSLEAARRELDGWACETQVQLVGTER